MSYDSYCGLYCGACEVLHANLKGLVEMKAKEWNVSPEDIKCNGCKSGIISVYCRKCEIRNCSRSKNLEYCFQCKDYPCNMLIKFRNDGYAHHSVILYNLNMIREKGIGSWLEYQEQRWKCPDCGEIYTWYDRECFNCGNSLVSCEDEKKIRDSFSPRKRKRM